MPSAQAASHSRLPPPAGLWRNADFRRLWVGQTASQFGEQATLVVLPLIAVLALNADAAQLGVLRAVGQVPVLLLALPVGAWVDRWRTRTASSQGALLPGSGAPGKRHFHSELDVVGRSVFPGP